LIYIYKKYRVKPMTNVHELDALAQPSEGAVVPVTILTGFLGSGKSTFLNQIFKDPDFKNTLVIVNEFGEIGLDHLLIEKPDENIVLLEGGCLCCEVRGDLVQTLTDIYQRRFAGKLITFDRIIIETTGLSNPVPIIQSILCDIELRTQYKLGKVITMVDSREIREQVDKFTEAIEQIAVADLLLISKMDIADHLPMHELKSILQPINPGSPIAICKFGKMENINLKKFLCDEEYEKYDAFMQWLDRSEDFIISKQRLHSEELQSQASLHPIGIKQVSLLSMSNHVHSLSLKRDGIITGNSFVIWLNLLATMKGKNILRLKAILNVEGKPIALHGTHTIIHEPIEMNQWPSADQSSRFVLISNGPLHKQFERSLELLNFNVEVKDKATLINPQAYQNFLKIAESFSHH
jgi:G3E family GTPase